MFINNIMGCGIGKSHNHAKHRITLIGRLGKQNFIIRKYTAFADDYFLEQFIGNGMVLK